MLSCNSLTNKLWLLDTVSYKGKRGTREQLSPIQDTEYSPLRIQYSLHGGEMFHQERMCGWSESQQTRVIFLSRSSFVWYSRPRFIRDRTRLIGICVFPADSLELCSFSNCAELFALWRENQCIWRVFSSCAWF